MVRLIINILLMLLVNIEVQSSSIFDTIPFPQKLRLSIFLDCSICDHDFIRNNFDLVNYVRSPADADVHVLVTSLPSGNGGYNCCILLIGKNRFRTMNDTVEFYISPKLSLEEERYAILNKIKLSLVYYLIKTPLGDRIKLVVYEDQETDVREMPEDPWKDWVFNLSLSGNISGNKSNLSYSVINKIYISKITSAIKFESSNELNYSEDRYRIFNGDSLIFSTRSLNRSISSKSLFVKSLGEHGGIGGMAYVLSSDYNNLDLQARAGPAIEGNLYKYSQVSSKQLRLIYSLYFQYNNYANRTINNRMSDDHFRNELNLIFRKIGTWGYIDLSLNANAYLNDISQFSASTTAFANINLNRNILINMGINLGLYHDQVSLKQEAVSVDQVLTGQRELATAYSYYFNFGISYRFGSKYNNHVNPRFDHQ